MLIHVLQIHVNYKNISHALSAAIFSRDYLYMMDRNITGRFYERLRVVCGGGHFSTVSGPIRVDELPLLAEQFVRMGAEVISLRL